MTARNLEFLFRPKSVAVVAEERDANHYARLVRQNLASAGFAGPLIDAKLKKRISFKVGNRLHVEKTDVVPELAIICATLDEVPQIVTQLGALGTRALILGPSHREKSSGIQTRSLFNAILDAARPKLMRILGPGSAGLIVPAQSLNASVAPLAVTQGKIALVTHSASIASAIIDRAQNQGIGFSTVVHLGGSIDVDLADVLDWLAADPKTESILVQFDAVVSGRKFMSAARASARNKPVVAIRCGHREHVTNGPFTTDDLYETALRRAGWVIIDTLADLFEATEAMARARPMHGERVCIVGNGDGLGQIACDTLRHSGGQLASLSHATETRLGEITGYRPRRYNPLALPANVTPPQWAAALGAVLDDGGADAVLTICSPSPYFSGADVATALCAVPRIGERNIFSCWVGGDSMLEAQKIAAAHGVMSHSSPENAIAVFLGIAGYQRNHRLLMQMPPSLAENFLPDEAVARGVLREAIDAGADILSAHAARRLLHAYGIDAGDLPHLGSIEATVQAADAMGYPVDLLLTLAHAPENAPTAGALRSANDIHIAASHLRRAVRVDHPGVRVTGYQLRPSAPRSGTHALRLGVVEDAVFGPVIYLGPSADASCRKCRFVLALPPLNLALANDLVARSGCAQDAPEEQRTAHEAALATLLVRVSQLLTDLDEVTGIELDPLHAEPSGARALDVRIRVAKRGRKLGHRRFAICPYPKGLERNVDWDGRPLVIRPIRPEDETALGDLLSSLAPDDARMRFFDTMRRLPRSQLARFTQVDYDREMALVAMAVGDDGSERSLGEARLVTDPDNAYADFAIVVRSELKGQGLGRLLLNGIIDYARRRGIGELRGETLSSNARMQRLAKELGFQVQTGSEWGMLDLRLTLRAAQLTPG